MLFNLKRQVGASEAALLNMLNISPFTYGMNIKAVYDRGTIFSPEVLDVEDEDFIQKVFLCQILINLLLIGRNS